MDLAVGRMKFATSCAVVGAAAASFLKWLEERTRQCVPTRVIIDLHNASDDPNHITSVFAHANTPTLMASYVIFFPRFLDRYGSQALTAVDSAVAKELRAGKAPNRHRLTALPAVIAAHLLPRTRTNQKEELWTEIANTLTNRNREVLEIVLQNLIGAASYDSDATRFFSLDTKVLRAIDKLIRDAQDTETLISPH